MVTIMTRAVAGVSALALLAVLLVGAPIGVVGSPTGVTVATVRPAIRVSPHYAVVGRADVPPHAVTFACQLTIPAGCYGPAQIRTAYGVDRVPATGAGRTIVIVDAFQSPTIAADLALFNRLFGLPDVPLSITAPDGLTPFDPSNATMVGWAGEITLDVEWAHAIAPGARIALVLARSDADADVLSATRYAVDDNLGDVISQSFGEAEQCMDPALLAQQHLLFARAVARGVTLLASSGDQGSAQPTCDGRSFIKAVSTPASDPFVTAVGGTRLFANGLTGAYQSESVWNEPAFAAASGGGFSVVYGTPSYQSPLRLRSRGLPDVAYNAAIIGGVLGVWSSSGEGPNLVFRFGGTSAGSPQWAGLVALVGQLAGHRVGWINPLLYGLAGNPVVYPRVFHDVTVGDNTFHGPVTVPGFAAGPGWDAATGLGSPRAEVLAGAVR